jgi:hypothetical protein
MSKVIDVSELATTACEFGKRSNGKKIWTFPITANGNPLAFQINSDDPEQGAHVPPFCCSTNNDQSIDYVVNLDNDLEITAMQQWQDYVAKHITANLAQFGLDEESRLSKTGRLVQYSKKTNKYGETYAPSLRSKIEFIKKTGAYNCKIADQDGEPVKVDDLHNYRWVSMVIEIPSIFVSQNGMWGIVKRCRVLSVKKFEFEEREVEPANFDLIEHPKLKKPKLA